MFCMLIFCAAITATTPQILMIDFGKGKSGPDWEIVNDDVMGGRSSSSAVLEADRLVFKGRLSLENNGGFASVRGPLKPMDLSGFDKVRIRYRSSDDRFALRLATDTRYYRPVHKHYFGGTDESGWKEEAFDLREFQEYVLGKPTGNSMDTDHLSNVLRIGIMLSDKQEGEFFLEVDYIEFFKGSEKSNG